ncbi:TPA: hypothetical protein R0348_001978 [Salmonella enterica subsp. enterica serovar Hvittingfoss]|nr:hypothetical protein [Salmonella enterica subsp. enterica serovar Hvittingfoss]
MRPRLPDDGGGSGRWLIPSSTVMAILPGARNVLLTWWGIVFQKRRPDTGGPASAPFIRTVTGGGGFQVKALTVPPPDVQVPPHLPAQQGEQTFRHLSKLSPATERHGTPRFPAVITPATKIPVTAGDQACQGCQGAEPPRNDPCITGTVVTREFPVTGRDGVTVTRPGFFNQMLNTAQHDRNLMQATFAVC